ncbi:hypothetical protein Tco_0864357 [Tanacetum coccineum]
MVEDGYSLAENVAYNVVKEKATHSLIKALSNKDDDKQRSLQRLCYYYLRSTRVGQALYPSEDIQRIYELFVSPEDKNRGRVYDRGQEAEHKDVKIMEDRRDKPPVIRRFNMAARDSDDTSVCCVKNTVEDRIIDYGASFHATYCKEELERFKLRSGKVRLTDDKTLDIASVEDVVLKTSFSTTWSLKDVRIVMLKMVPKTPLQFGPAERLSRTFRAEKTRLRAEDPKMLWADLVSTACLIYRIPYVLIGLCIPEEEWRGKDTSLAHFKVFSCDSFVKVTYVCEEAMKCIFIGCNSDEMRCRFWDKKSHQVIQSKDIAFIDSIYGTRSATDSSSLTKPIQKS